MLRTFGNYDPDEVSLKSGLSCPEEEGKTMQQFAQDADINTIVERFGLGLPVPENFAIPLTGDFTSVGDFHDAMLAVRAAEEAFMTLPADVRERFQHDPGRLIKFLDDDNNRDEAVKLGLVQKPPEVTRPTDESKPPQ